MTLEMIKKNYPLGLAHPIQSAKTPLTVLSSESNPEVIMSPALTVTSLAADCRNSTSVSPMLTACFSKILTASSDHEINWSPKFSTVFGKSFMGNLFDASETGG